jgi:hypothetical protein
VATRCAEGGELAQDMLSSDTPSLTGHDNIFRFESSQSRLLDLPTLPLPIEPAPSVFCNLLVSTLFSDLRSCATPYSSFTVEHDFLIDIRLLKPKTIFELFCGQQQCVRIRGYRDVDRGRDESGFIFVGLADVNEEEIRGWVGGDLFDL